MLVHLVPRFGLRAGCPVRERRSALAQLQARHPALPEERPARPERHLAQPARQPEADCPGAVRYASGVAACQLQRAGAEVCRHRPAVLPEEAQSESAAPLRAAWQPVAAASGRVRPSPAADRVQHPPEAMACRAQARLQPGASAQLAVSQPRVASWCAAVAGASPDEAAEGGRQPEVLAVAEALRQGAVAVQDGAAAERQPAAAQDVVAVERQPEAAPGAEAVRLREARDVPAAALPSAAPWACHQDRLRPWPVQARSAHPARVTEGRRSALP
jgi:hypothetical protein